MQEIASGRKARHTSWRPLSLGVLIEDYELGHSQQKTEGTFARQLQTLGFTATSLCLWEKLQVPSLLHLSQRSKTLKAITLGLPEDQLPRKGICSLFKFFMFNWQQKINGVLFLDKKHCKVLSHYLSHSLTQLSQSLIWDLDDKFNWLHYWYVRGLLSCFSKLNSSSC